MRREETPRQQTLEKFDAFLSDIGMDVCDFFSVLAAAWRADATACSDETVKSLLEQAAHDVDQAGMDWYVSTK